nr:MAG: DNA pilot protein [Microvirus sp.]
MDWLGAAIGAIGSIIGGNNANSAAQAAAERQMEFQASQAQINRDWQSTMSNSAHQREVADLKAAGLNPILFQGSGASTGSVSTPSGASFTPINTMANLGRDLSSAVALKQGGVLQRSQVDVNKADVINKSAQAASSSAQTANINADTQIKLAEAKYRADMLRAGLELSGAQSSEAKSRIANNFKTNSLIDAQIMSEGARAGMFNASSAQAQAAAARSYSDIDVNQYTKGEISARTRQTETNTQGSLYDLERKRHEAAYQRDSQLAPFLPYVRNIIDTINPFHFK